MQLSQFLDFEAIRVDLAAGNKRQLLNQLAQIAAARLSLDPSADRRCDRASASGWDRPALAAESPSRMASSTSSTGSMRWSPGWRRRSTIRRSTDQPVDLVFLLLSPPDAGAEHLKALAAVSRLVRHAGIVEKLRGARSRDAMAAVLMGAEERDAA